MSQRGNAIVFILLAVALFGGLAYTFMRGAKSGQGNLTAGQAKMAAQELLNFISKLDKTISKLRMRGCSETDMNFLNSGDTGPFISVNTSATAPADHSCDIFHANGGNMEILDWSRYQIPQSQIPVGNAAQYDNIILRSNGYSVVGVGTSANEWMAMLNWVQPEVCRQINTLVNPNISETSDASPIYGDQNLSLVGQKLYCLIYPGTVGGFLHYVWMEK